MEDTKLKDILGYNFLSGLEISPDGNKLAYRNTKANYKENKYDTNLFIYDLSTEENYQATDHNEVSIYSFDHDSKLIYKKDSSDEEDVFFIKEGSGVGSRDFSIKKEVRSMIYLDNDLFLLEVKDKKTKEENETKKNNSYYIEIKDLPFYFNGLGFLENDESAYYIYDKAKDEMKFIAESNEENPLSFSDINDSFDKALFLKTNYDSNKVMGLKEDLVLIDLKDGSQKTIISNKFSFYTAKFIEDKIIFVASDMKKGGVNEDCFIYIADLDGSFKKISPDDFDKSFGNSVGTDARFGSSRTFQVANGKLYFLVTEFEESILYSIDLFGNIVKEIPGQVEDFVVKDDAIYYLAMDKDSLAELKKKDKKEVLVENKIKTRVNPIETFNFKSNGDELTGFVVLPKDFDKNKKYPTLLSIHGGPKTEFSDIFHHEHQMFTNSGYIIIFTNPHGSSGRGVKFSDIRGSYGSTDYDDLMTFTDLAIEKYPQIDKEKMGVYGGSYGGFMTNWIVGHTDRFKAACSQRSISNWTSFYGVSDIGYYFAPDQTAADPWNNLEKMWDQSPIKYGKNVKTPTLFIHSDEDYRCPLEQGMQMYTRIKLNGVDSKMCIFHGENHELSRSGKPKGRIKRLEEIKAWFDKYLKDEI